MKVQTYLTQNLLVPVRFRFLSLFEEYCFFPRRRCWFTDSVGRQLSFISEHRLSTSLLLYHLIGKEHCCLGDLKKGNQLWWSFFYFSQERKYKSGTEVSFCGTQRFHLLVVGCVGIHADDWGQVYAEIMNTPPERQLSLQGVPFFTSRIFT